MDPTLSSANGQKIKKTLPPKSRTRDWNVLDAPAKQLRQGAYSVQRLKLWNHFKVTAQPITGRCRSPSLPDLVSR